MTDPAEVDEPNPRPAPTPPRHRVRQIVLAALLAIGLAGAATLAYTGFKVNSQRHAALTAPAQIGDLKRDVSEEAAATADYLQNALTAEIGFDKSIGAIYTGTDNKNVLLFGGTNLIWSPGKQLDAAFGLISDEQGKVTGLRDVDPGQLGGTMRCGVTESPEADLTICGWADHGSLALAMFTDRTPDQAADLFRQIRTATQSRS